MKEHTILFPVCGILYPYRISHCFCWLARYLPAKLCLVEVLLPTGWVRWLLGLFRKEDKEWRLQAVERLVFQQNHIECETETVRVPNLTIGIVEAAWLTKPNFVILTPELQEILGKAGLRDLKTRLGEMGRCMLILFSKGPTIRLEPCCTTDSRDIGRVIRIKFS